MSNQRPFAVGDMAVSKAFGICRVCQSSERQIRIMPVNGISRLYGKDGKWMYDEISPDIVCIRKPRKGEKEARDICAMLLREYIKFVKFYIFEGCGFERPYHNKEIKHYYDDLKSKHSIYLCYQKAKLMLK